MPVDLTLYRGKGLIVQPEQFDEFFTKEEKEEILYQSGFVVFDGIMNFYFFTMKCTELDTKEYNYGLAKHAVNDSFVSFALPLKKIDGKDDFVKKIISKIKKNCKIEEESLSRLQEILLSDEIKYYNWFVALWN